MFGDSVDFDHVFIATDSPTNRIFFGIQDFFTGNPDSRAFTTGNLINFDAADGPIERHTMVHEMTHVWQNQNVGPIYLAHAIATHITMGDDGSYNYGYFNNAMSGSIDLPNGRYDGSTVQNQFDGSTIGEGGRTVMENTPADHFMDFQPEQQGQIMMHYFARRVLLSRPPADYAPWENPRSSSDTSPGRLCAAAACSSQRRASGRDSRARLRVARGSARRARSVRQGRTDLRSSARAMTPGRALAGSAGRHRRPCSRSLDSRDAACRLHGCPSRRRCAPPLRATRRACTCAAASERRWFWAMASIPASPRRRLYSRASLFRWTSDLLRAKIVEALGSGLGLGVYIGHGRPMGWVRYRHPRPSTFAGEPAPAPFTSLLPHLGRRRVGLSYAERFRSRASPPRASTHGALHRDNPAGRCARRASAGLDRRSWSRAAPRRRPPWLPIACSAIPSLR